MAQPVRSDALTIVGATLVLPDRIVVGPLHVQTGRIVAEPMPGATLVELPGHRIYPAPLNGHEHLQLNCIPRPSLAGPFPNAAAWIAALQEHFGRPELLAARALPPALRHWHGGLKNLLCGVLSVAHHDPWHLAFEDPEFPVHVLRGLSWCHSLGLAGRYGPSVEQSRTPDPLDAPWMIHLAEGSDESSAAELTELDGRMALDRRTVVIHGVGLRDRDIDKILERGAGVVWCPSSNLETLGRTLDPRRLFDAGRLALGTDSRISGSKDLLDEVRVAARHSDLRPAELLELATRSTARLLRAGDRGGLEAGQAADFLITTAQGADPFESWLGLERADLRAVVRGGLPVLADPDLGAWFETCGVATVPVRLDGREKLISAGTLRWKELVQLEPGLNIVSDTGGIL